MIGTAYLFQAALIVFWWVGITLSPSFYSVFEFPGIERNYFAAFLIPDILIIAVLSLYRAYKPGRDIQLIILGAFLYATLFCVNASLIGGGGYLSTLTMLLGLCFNVFLCYTNRMFRVAGSSSILSNSVKTILQIICVWSLTLVLIPLLILKAFNSSIIPEIGIPLWMGFSLFIAFSFLGLWSSFEIVRKGDGTPLPLDQTNKLVTTGPYNYVRNPMAVAGVGQGFAIGIVFSSFPIIFYAILGAVIWHIAVRPREEEDMLKRFGPAYKDYQSKVRCWIPNITWS